MRRRCDVTQQIRSRREIEKIENLKPYRNEASTLDNPLAVGLSESHGPLFFKAFNLQRPECKPASDI